MTWTPWSDLRVRAAAAFALVAVGLAARAGFVALGHDAVVPAAPMTSASPPIIARAAMAPRAALARLEALAPFGETQDGLPSAAPDIVTTLPIILVGTIAGADQPSAVCRLGPAAPRILHIGDTLGGWHLRQIAPGRVIFVDAAGHSHELRLTSPGN
jgi:hypothetical protein